MNHTSNVQAQKNRPASANNNIVFNLDISTHKMRRKNSRTLFFLPLHLSLSFSLSPHPPFLSLLASLSLSLCPTLSLSVSLHLSLCLYLSIYLCVSLHHSL